MEEPETKGDIREQRRQKKKYSPGGGTRAAQAQRMKVNKGHVRISKKTLERLRKGSRIKLPE